MVIILLYNVWVVLADIILVISVLSVGMAKTTSGLLTIETIGLGLDTYKIETTCSLIFTIFLSVVVTYLLKT